MVGERCIIEFGTGDKSISVGTIPGNHSLVSILISQLPMEAIIGKDPAVVGIDINEHKPLVELRFTNPESLLSLKQRVDRLYEWMTVPDGDPNAEFDMNPNT